MFALIKKPGHVTINAQTSCQRPLLFGKVSCGPIQATAKSSDSNVSYPQLSCRDKKTAHCPKAGLPELVAVYNKHEFCEVSTMHSHSNIKLIGNLPHTGISLSSRAQRGLPNPHPDHEVSQQNGILLAPGQILAALQIRHMQQLSCCSASMKGTIFHAQPGDDVWCLGDLPG